MASLTAARPTPGAAASALAVLIEGYQRYISPHKGFRCAHRVAHGGLSCSGYAKHVLLRRGVAAAMRRMRARFAACAAAAVLLHAAAASAQADTQRRQARAECAGNAGDCCMCAPDPWSIHLASGSCDAAACVDVAACWPF
ncbi:MAG: membrane protein insertion efficiency factor YidD [Casimicrobiaceae bacterium]